MVQKGVLRVGGPVMQVVGPDRDEARRTVRLPLRSSAEESGSAKPGRRSPFLFTPIEINFLGIPSASFRCEFRNSYAREDGDRSAVRTIEDTRLNYERQRTVA